MPSTCSTPPTAAIAADEFGLDADDLVLSGSPGAGNADDAGDLRQAQYRVVGEIGDRASVVIDGDAHTGGERAVSILIATPDSRTRNEFVDSSNPYLGMVDAFARAVQGGTPWPRPMSNSIELLRLIERVADASR